MSDKKQTIVIILLSFSLLIPIFGIFGLILMWFWTRWPKWVKVLLTFFSPIAIIISTMFFLFIYIFIARPFQIVGNAMSPNLYDKEYVFTSLISERISLPTRGDIIVFVSPVDKSKDIVKRVVGIPGDNIRLHGGFVYLNGEKLNEKYLSGNASTYGGSFLKDDQSITLPSNMYFVLGDNRSYSSDSRELGFVPMGNIISKVEFCYWNCK